MKCSSTATVIFMHKSEIHVNGDSMESLTLEEKISWVESSLTRIFNIDPSIQRVVVVDVCEILPKKCHVASLIPPGGNSVRPTFHLLRIFHNRCLPPDGREV